MTEFQDYPSQLLAKRAAPLYEPNRARACDLFSVFNRAADEAAAEVLAGGLALTLQFDPALRDPRMACPATVAQAVKTTIRAMLRMTRRGAVSLCASVGYSREHVIMAVSSLLDGAIEPDPGLFAQAAEQARDLGGRLKVEREERRLTLSLVFPAPPSQMTVLLIEQDWPGRCKSVQQLQSGGFNVDVASDGEAALRISSGAPYVAVLVDLYLEEENVLHLVTCLQSANRTAPVFALSREGLAVASWALAKAGLVGMVESPVTPGALRAALASVEAAELKAVEAGENADEDGNGQDRDHGRSSSAVIRSA